MNHSKDITRLEERIMKTIEGAVSLDKAKEAVFVNIMQAESRSASTTADIRAGVALLRKMKQSPMVAALSSQEDEFLRAQKERLDILQGKGTAGGSGGLPPTNPTGVAANPDQSDPGDYNEDDDDDDDSHA